MKNGIIALAVLTISVVSTQSASATSPRCTALMAATNASYADLLKIDPNLLRLSTAIPNVDQEDLLHLSPGLSFVGTVLGVLGAYAEVGRLREAVSVLTPSASAAAGTLTSLWIISRISSQPSYRGDPDRDGHGQNTIEDNSSDSIRVFRSTEYYSCIRADLGRRRSEEFIADLFSGWSAERLAQKYLSSDEQQIIQEQIADIQLLHEQQDNPCADEGMSCEG